MPPRFNSFRPEMTLSRNFGVNYASGVISSEKITPKF
jgi:hypothetical protein